MLALSCNLGTGFATDACSVKGGSRAQSKRKRESERLEAAGGVSTHFDRESSRSRGDAFLATHWHLLEGEPATSTTPEIVRISNLCYIKWLGWKCLAVKFNAEAVNHGGHKSPS